MVRMLLWLIFIPLQLLLLVVFLLSETIHWFLAVLKDLPGDSFSTADQTLCSLVILNWNGRHLLEECLPPLLEEIRNSGKPHEVIVVDNGSTDDSVSWVRGSFPEVVLVELEKNFGFGEGNNRGVEAASHDIVVLLNNDMIVSAGFIDPLLEAFSDPDVFAVSSQIFFPEGRRREETGNTHGTLRRGYLHLSHESVRPFHSKRDTAPILWAGGGSSAFHRERFLQLGGFSTLYSPCYLEDTDLSYRAWRRGWKVLFAANSKVLHKHRSSSEVRFTPQELETLIEERKLWYLWSNYQLISLMTHFILFPFNLTNRVGILGYLRALRKLPAILLSRLSEPRRHVNDRTLENWIEHPLVFLNRFNPERQELARTSDDPLKILVVSAYLPHLGTHGGAGRVYQLLKRTSKKHEVTLIAFVESQSEQQSVQQVEGFCKRIEIVPRNDFEPLSFFPYEPFEEFNSPDFREKLEELLTEEDYDIVHFEWTQMALYADLTETAVKFLTEIEANYAAHRTTIAVEPRRSKRFLKLYQTLQTLYREVQMCRRVDHTICVTEEDKSYLKRYLPESSISVVNTGVDTQYFYYAPQIKEPKSLLFVGAFRHSPNTEAMRYFCDEVFPRILASEPETHLYIVGSSPTEEMRLLGAHPSITVTGYVEDIREYYHRAQVVVVPLRTGVGIRGKVLEAWSVGKATIATRLACQGIRAGHGENALLADSSEEFSMWTTALLRSPDFCQELGECGRKTAEDFYDWDVIAGAMTRKYEEVAGS